MAVYDPFLLRTGVPAEPRALLTKLFDPTTDSQTRFAVGHRLARIGDPRPGVGLRPDGLPEIEWLEVPGGEYTYQAGETFHTLPTYYIARYPVTVMQYAAFIIEDGYRNPGYWTPRGWAWKDANHATAPALWGHPKWHLANHPLVGVTWYEACAFCTWLAVRLGLDADMIRLPSEWEWEKAGRGVDGRLYPWGNRAYSGYANFNETYAYHYVGRHFLRRTTAVGVFVRDRSPYGVMDMAGNVREWCLTSYYGIGRVVRGGGWFSNSLQAQMVYRNWFYEGNADHSIGFRPLAVVLPSHATLFGQS